MTEWEMLKIKELADVLQLNQETVRNAVNRGELEWVKIGRTKFIPREAAVRFAGGTGMEMPELLTVAQVAELLKLNPQTIRNHVDAGLIPAVRIGRRVRIKRSDLDAVIDGNPYAKADRFWGEQGSARSIGSGPTVG